MKKSLKLTIVILFITLIGVHAAEKLKVHLFSCGSDITTNPLKADFKFPQYSAKPQVWWHWMNGNVTKAGITADLEAMEHVGIGGAMIVNVANKSAVNVPAGSVDYMSPEWLDLVRFASDEANRLGLKIGLANSAGWSGTGGPWVTPENSMKKVVWSETKVSKAMAPTIQLTQPRSEMNFYRDIAVLAFPSPKSKGVAIASEKIINLTDKMDASGCLNWQLPAGNWTVLRVGYTTNGKMTRPAPESATGLETDKLSRQALDAHWLAGIQPVLDKLGSLTGKVMTTILLDSYEAGKQDWTADMPQEFRERRGYDLTRYLPVLTGRIVDSNDESNRFLWDFKRTIADLFADNYYGYFADKCHQSGLLFASEAYGNGGFESMQAGSSADISMGEFWVNRGIHFSPKVAASCAHINGRILVGAESFTSRPEQGRWQNYPGSLKALGDLMWCYGINRYYFHTCPHQPWLDKFPGMTMGMWGSHFGRTTTWWKQSGAWMNYIARSQSLLQKGRFVADVLIFTGETPSKYSGTKTVALRAAGYDYDFCGTDLIKKVRVENGSLVLPSGMSYRVLVLNDEHCMSPELAVKIRELVRDGATVIATRPEKSPSLENYPQCDNQVKAIASEVWGDNNDLSVGEHIFGKGCVIWGRGILDVLSELAVTPDFKPANVDTKMHYIHRAMADTDIYFISYQGDDTKMEDCFFRVTGRQPEFWNPLTGEIKPATLWQAEDNGTRVTIPLGQNSSLFVVFYRPTSLKETKFIGISSDTLLDSGFLPAVIATPQGEKLLAWDNGKYTLKESFGGDKIVVVDSLPNPITLDQPWTVNFTPGWGAPEKIELQHLQDWIKNPDPGVRYYSGTGIYHTVLKLPSNFVSKADRIELNLGQVEILAEVILNGHNLGVVWCNPFRVDITKAVKAGDNKLEIRVVNLWPNRMIGDEQYPQDVKWTGRALQNWPDWIKNGTPRPSNKRLTFATWHHWTKNDALFPSGLLGPVKVRAGRLIKITH